jgi:hypothetical protein
MSSFYIIGFLELTGGRRSPTLATRADGSASRLWHVFYQAEVLCSDGARPPFHAEVRKYSEPGELVLAENTVAFLVAKAYVPAGAGTGVVQLEASHIVPVPGDSSSSSYSGHLLNFWHPMAFLLGVVDIPKGVRPVGQNGFFVTVSEYVRGAQRQSQIECVLRSVQCTYRCVTLMRTLSQMHFGFRLTALEEFPAASSRSNGVCYRNST